MTPPETLVSNNEWTAGGRAPPLAKGEIDRSLRRLPVACRACLANGGLCVDIISKL